MEIMKSVIRITINTTKKKILSQPSSMQHTKIQNMTTSSIVDTTALRLKVGVKALYLNVKDSNFPHL